MSLLACLVVSYTPFSPLPRNPGRYSFCCTLCGRRLTPLPPVLSKSSRPAPCPSMFGLSSASPQRQTATARSGFSCAIVTKKRESNKNSFSYGFWWRITMTAGAQTGRRLHVVPRNHHGTVFCFTFPRMQLPRTAFRALRYVHRIHRGRTPPEQ